MSASVELVIFAIRSALRINAQYRRAFADSTLDRPLTLPLPSFEARPNLATVEAFYDRQDVQELIGSNLRVVALLRELQDEGRLQKEAERELFSLYREHRLLVEARDGTLFDGDGGENPGVQLGLGHEDVVVLLQIRQWRPGEDPNPTLLRRLAGTFVNIAVDYFVDIPDALSTASSRGRALRAFLESVDRLDFTEDAPTEVVEQLFVATVEILRDRFDLLDQADKSGLLLQSAFGALYDSARERLAELEGDLSAQDRVRDWVRLVYRSVLEGAGEAVFADPETFLGLREGESELVGRVGRSILGVVLDQEGLDLDRLLSRETLDGVVKAALEAVGQHPELLGEDEEGLTRLLAALATGLSESSVAIGRGFLPEAIRIILERTGENLELLLPEGEDDPKRHLLLLAGRSLLAELAVPPAADAGWKLRLSPELALDVLESVFDEVLQNPRWVEEILDEEAEEGDVGERILLATVAAEVLATLRALPGPKLTTRTGFAILTASLKVAGQRLELLTEDDGIRRIVRVLDAVLGTVFAPGVDRSALWTLARDAVIERLMALALDAIARNGATLEKIERVRQVVEETIALLAAAEPWSLEDFGLRLKAELGA